MNSNNEDENHRLLTDENQQKVLLKESRRVRRKLKKEEKQNKKEKEKEQKTLVLKYGPRDTKVTIVTKEFANSVTNSSKVVNLSHSEITEEDFPALGQSFKNKVNNFKTSTNVTTENTVQISSSEESSKRTKIPIRIDIKDLITKPEKTVITKDKINFIKQYEGNMLDSSKPERKRGKHREIPQKKLPSKIKSCLLKESLLENIPKDQYTGNHSPLFEIYCDNCVTNELNEASTVFLKEIVNFQEKLFKRDSVKGISKRRYVVGFHEVKKFLKIGKVQLIIFAPNIKINFEDGILYTTINSLKKLANANDTPYVFSLSKRIIGRLCLKNVPVSCVGILDYSGAEESFKKVLELLYISREFYKNTQPVNEDKEDVEELKDKLLQALK